MPVVTMKPFFLCELPSNYAGRVDARLWIARILITWAFSQP